MLKQSKDILDKIPDNQQDEHYRGSISAALAKLGWVYCLRGDNKQGRILIIEGIKNEEPGTYFYYSFMIDYGRTLLEENPEKAFVWIVVGTVGCFKTKNIRWAGKGILLLSKYRSWNRIGSFRDLVVAGKKIYYHRKNPLEVLQSMGGHSRAQPE